MVLIDVEVRVQQVLGGVVGYTLMKSNEYLQHFVSNMSVTFVGNMPTTFVVNMSVIFVGNMSVIFIGNISVTFVGNTCL